MENPKKESASIEELSSKLCYLCEKKEELESKILYSQNSLNKYVFRNSLLSAYTTLCGLIVDVQTAIAASIIAYGTSIACVVYDNSKILKLQKERRAKILEIVKCENEIKNYKKELK